MRPTRPLVLHAPSVPVLATALVTGLALLTGCGSATAPGRMAPPGEWSVQQLSAGVGVDTSPVLAVDGGDALVLAVDESGSVVSHVSRDGAAFERGAPVDSGRAGLALVDAVALPDGGWFVLAGGGTVDDELVFDVLAWRSDDGLAWEQLAVTGFADAAEVNDLVVVDDTIVAAGSYRRAAEPSHGGFEAQVWTSADGHDFREVHLAGVPAPRGHRDESYAGHLAVAGDRVLVGGRVGRHATLWAADVAALGPDGWPQVDSGALREAYDLSGLAAVGDTVVAGLGDSGAPALVSTDAGRTWAPVDDLGSGGEEGGWAPVWADGTRFWTLGGVDGGGAGPWDDLAACYADPARCGQEPAPVLVASVGGATWSPVSFGTGTSGTGDLGADDFDAGDLDAVVGTADGRVLALTVGEQGPLVHTLPAGTRPPPGEYPAAPERVEVVVPEPGQAPEVGVRYHAPMYLHCGMDWFWFADTTWRRTDDGPDVETGAGDVPPEAWGGGGNLLGFATLTDPDHLDYSLADGTVIASYEQRDGAPGCA